MNQIVGQIIFGLPLLVESFTRGYAIIPAFVCALLLGSAKLNARTKLMLALAVIVLAAFCVASFDPTLVIAVILLMLPAVAVLTMAFAVAFWLLRIVGKNYDRFLDGPSNA